MTDHNVACTSALDQCLNLSQKDNAGSLSSGDFTEAASLDMGIGLVCDSGDIIGLVPGKSLEGDFGVACGYFNGRQSGIDDCNVEIDGLRMEKVGSSDYNGGLINSLEDCERSLELRNSDRLHEQKDDWSGSVQGDTEEKSAGLAATGTDFCNQMLSSSDCEIPVEIRSLNALPRNRAEPDKEDTVASLEGVMEVVENKSIGLSRVETENHHGKLSEMVPTIGALCNCNNPSAEEVTEVMKDESNALPVIDATIHDNLSSCQNASTSLELMPTIGSPEKNIQQDKQNDGGLFRAPFEEGVTEKENDLLAGVKSTTNNQILSSLDDKMCMKSDFVDYCQQNDMEAKITSSLSLERAVDANDDVLTMMESDGCTQKALNSIEMPRELSVTGPVLSIYDRQNDQRKGEDVNCHTAESIPRDNLKRSDVDQSIQATLENLVTDGSLGSCDQKNEQRNDRSVYGPSMERTPDVVEEESDVTTEMKVGTHGLKFCVVADAHNLKDDSPEISPHTVQSWQAFDVAENGSYNKLDVPNRLENVVFGNIYSSSAADPSEQIDNEGKDCAGNDGLSKTACSDIGSASSRRSNRKCKSGQKTQTAKRAARKGKNKGKVRDFQIFKAERRKRSCLSKPARSSNWGLLGNITQFFEQSNGLDFNEILNHESQTKNGGGSGKMSRKWKSSRASGSSQGSSGKKPALTSGIRLKVKVGKEVAQNSLNIMVPQVIDTSVSAACGVREFDIKSYQGTSFGIPNFANGIKDKMRQEETEDQLQCSGNELEEAKIYSDASISDLHVAENDLHGTLTSGKSVADAPGDYIVVPSHVEVEALGEVVEKRYTDPETSPDSEVINLVPEGQVNSICQEDFPDAVFTSSKVFVAAGVVTSSNRGKKKDRLTHASDCSPEDISPDVASVNNVKATKKRGSRQRKGNEFLSNEIHISPTGVNASSSSSISKEFSGEQLHLSRETGHGVAKEDLQAEVSAETKICSGVNVVHRLSESQNSNKLLPSSKSKGRQLPRKSGVGKGRSKVSDKARSKSANGFRHKESKQKSINKNKIKEKNDCDHVVCKAEDDLETTKCIADDYGKSNPGDSVASIGVANLHMASNDVMEQHVRADNAWVRCDDCHKWRRIPVALVDSIGQTNCQWICKDNFDTAFADCSIPQEKSNAEINAELGISDADEDAYDIPSKNKGLECKRKTVSKEHEFTRISTNQFLHRSRKTLTIDEIMVCHCKPPLGGGLGCGDECLNRMLNIECVQGTCPCGDFCSNQQFQKRNYAKMKWDRCGKKGFGLRLEEAVSKGQFLIEYVGEVLDVHTYAARQREYASKSHKHFYFMTLDGSEVIDACAKGNLGRFINHSCDPNCRTEKWVVNGEICIGLFALRDIKKGEEVTFDYNYVRVVGAAAKICYCGSPHCQGYIGGDLRNSEVIDQVDSDEEFLEPVMLEDGETGDAFKKRAPRISSLDGIELQVADSLSKDRDTGDTSTAAAGKVEVVSEIEVSMNQSASSPVSQLRSSLEIEDLKEKSAFASPPMGISVESDDVASKSTSAVKHVISKEEFQRSDASSTAMLGKSSSDVMVDNRKSKSATAEEKRVFVKSRFLIKTSHESGLCKKGKFTSNPSNLNKVQMTTNKSQVLPVKPKKFIDGTSNGRFEAVEEKLNDLLDADGGISKRKDAPKGYLKLLLLTAASGASGNGEAIQSNRDLSMILGALLKTKSRVVLVDIINKNGLRMLHNMLKQYQKDFKKTPILRKLLKVLEYLAVREILTAEHISGGPPCPGMESFSDSILSLTEHNDKQVHQIARNFRDKWIPRHIRKYGYMDREDGKMEFHRGSISNRVAALQNYLHDQVVRPTEAIDCATQSKLATISVDTAVHEDCSAPCDVGGIKTRKRKSRWDQPADEKASSRSFQLDEQKLHSVLLQQSEYKPPLGAGNEVLDSVEKPSREDSYCPHCFRNYCRQDVASCADNERQNAQSDVPPGFSSPLNLTPVSSNASSTIANLPVGHPQRKFISRLSVSYGIPLPILQQFGSPQDGTVENWAIAPGIPFHPFPPLPPFPHNKKETPASAVNAMVIDETAEGQQTRHNPATCYPNENNPNQNGTNKPDLDIPGEYGQQTCKRSRGSSHDLGRRYFRQQKWNKGPSCVWNSREWGFSENNLRGGVCSTNVESVTNEHRKL